MKIVYSPFDPKEWTNRKLPFIDHVSSQTSGSPGPILGSPGPILGSPGPILGSPGPILESPGPILGSPNNGGICFGPGTSVLTDQGNIVIEKIDSKINTIDGKKIIGITKTMNNDGVMICIEKDALGLNVPSRDTLLTPAHKVLYNGKMKTAKSLSKKIEKIHKIQYDGVVFNVLMKKYDLISVHNMTCETLHPKNKMAKLFMKTNK